MNFMTNGVLSVGIHDVETWHELEGFLGFNQHRRELLTGLKQACYLLAKAGCKTVYLDGSFVTSKEFPNDFDACWDTTNIDWDNLDTIFLQVAFPRLE